MTQYNAIGTFILPCRRPGKYKVQRVALEKDELVVLQTVTEDRALGAAHKIAVVDLEKLATDLSRGKVSFVEPEQLRLKFE